MCKTKDCLNKDAVYSDGLCLYCYKYGADKPVKEKNPKPIAKHSKKRAAQNRIDQKQNKAIREKQPKCQMKLPGCKGIAEGVQHIGGRIGKRLTDLSNKIPACNNCNRRAEEKPNEALAKGVSKKKHVKN